MPTATSTCTTSRNRKPRGSRQALSGRGSVCFYFRVLHENYNDCLKRCLRQHGLDGTVLPGFGFVLFKLFESGATRPTDICRETGVKLPTLTAITDQMVKAGLIERRSDENDRRVTRLSLTGKGEALREDCFQVVDSLTETICEGIPKRDLDVAMKTMKQMMSNLSPE